MLPRIYLYILVITIISDLKTPNGLLINRQSLSRVYGTYLSMIVFVIQLETIWELVFNDLWFEPLFLTTNFKRLISI